MRLASLCLLAGCAPPVTGTAATSDQAGSGALGATPPLAYSDISGVRVLCHISGDSARGADLCRRITTRAAEGATLPVDMLAVGDPGVLDAGKLIIIVHGAVHRIDGRPVLAFTMRPFRNGSAETAVLFGATPHAVALEDDNALTGAIDSALDELLPWRSRPGARPIG